MDQSKSRKIGRMAFRVTKWTVGSLLGLIVLFVAVNAIDEDLTPEARALLIAPPNPYRPEENMYFALLGLVGPPGSSPIAVGQERVAKYENDLAMLLKDPQYAIHMVEEMQKEKTLAFQGKVDFCRPLTGFCFVGIETHSAEIVRLLRTNRELVQRYANLHDLNGYYEAATPSAYSLVAFGSPGTRGLYLANVALNVKTGTRFQQKAALLRLRDDIRVWRKMLAGSGSLISKMIAVAYLQGDYALLAEIIADRQFDLRTFSPEVRAMFDAVNEDDWKIGGAFAHEFRVSAFFWDQQWLVQEAWPSETSPEEAHWWERLVNPLATVFLKINATQNLQAGEAIQRKLVADATPEAYLATRDAYRKWLDKNVGVGLRYVYNPAGRIVVGIGSDYYEDYPLRAYDGAAFLRLVRLGYEIRNRNIEDRAIPDFMKQYLEWSTHPVDGKPFVWNGKTHEMALQPLGKQTEGRRFTISVWNAAPG